MVCGVSRSIDITINIVTVWFQVRIYGWRCPCWRRAYIRSTLASVKDRAHELKQSNPAERSEVGVLTWDQNGWHFVIEPVVRRDVLYISDFGRDIIYQDRGDIDLVDSLSEW